jgi:hypothetical protein
MIVSPCDGRKGKHIIRSCASSGSGKPNKGDDDVADADFEKVK